MSWQFTKLRTNPYSVLSTTSHRPNFKTRCLKESTRSFGTYCIQQKETEGSAIIMIKCLLTLEMPGKIVHCWYVAQRYTKSKSLLQHNQAKHGLFKVENPNMTVSNELAKIKVCARKTISMLWIIH